MGPPGAPFRLGPGAKCPSCPPPVGGPASNFILVPVRPEPIMLKILPIILSRISQKIRLLFFLLFLYPAYYSMIILIQYISVASRLVFKLLLLVGLSKLLIAIYEVIHLKHHFSIHSSYSRLRIAIYSNNSSVFY